MGSRCAPRWRAAGRRAVLPRRNPHRARRLPARRHRHRVSRATRPHIVRVRAGSSSRPGRSDEARSRRLRDSHAGVASQAGRDRRAGAGRTVRSRAAATGSARRRYPGSRRYRSATRRSACCRPAADGNRRPPPRVRLARPGRTTPSAPRRDRRKARPAASRAPADARCRAPGTANSPSRCRHRRSGHRPSTRRSWRGWRVPCATTTAGCRWARAQPAVRRRWPRGPADWPALAWNAPSRATKGGRMTLPGRYSLGSVGGQLIEPVHVSVIGRRPAAATRRGRAGCAGTGSRCRRSPSGRDCRAPA